MMKKQNIRHSIAGQLLKYHLCAFAVLCAIIALLYLLLDRQLQTLFTMLENRGGFNFIGVLDIQISVSFIVVSIVTIFAQKNVTIYWEDIMQYKMIRPRFTNFNALASYIFADLLASIVLIFCGSGYVYITFFLSILLIMVLSLRMLAAFFSGNLIRSELENTYRIEYEERLTDKAARSSYREHKRKLIQYTLQAIDSNEIDTVCENMSFLYRFQENDDTVYLVQKLVSDNRLYMLSRVAKVCQFIFASEEHIQEYERICRKIVANLDEDSQGYIRSIFKSMLEYNLENETDTRQLVQDTMNHFCEFCRELNHEQLAQELQDGYKKLLCNAEL